MKNFSLNLFIFFLLFPFIVSAQIVLPAYQGIQNKNNVVSYTGYSSTGFEGKTYKTTDSGVNWSEVNSYGYYDLFFINENIGYGVKFEPRDGNSNQQADNTYKTTNGGVSWTKINIKGYRDMFFINENIGYGIRYDQGETTYPAYDAGKTYKTTNGGVDWTAVNNIAYYDLFFINENIGYATRLAGEGGSTYKTTDGGANWTAVNSDGYSDLFFINENIGYGTKNEATPLIIAGGGGGKNTSYTASDPIAGQITEWGLGNASTLPTTNSENYFGGAGGGSWSSDGLPGDYDAEGGKGWNNYLEGGDHNTRAWGTGDGGFGGGGGPTWSGGAGGGYNGGPRVTSYGNYTPGGGGGGSYNGGTSQDNAIGEGNSHGEVIISGNGTTYTFTNCSKTGKSGPSQGDCNTAYTSTTLAGLVTLDNGIQLWQVPSTGTYIIEVWGAKGGGASGANGARMKGTFSLSNGETLRIAVGQMGTHTGSAGSGGGGTFVAKGNTHGGNTYKTTNGGVNWTKVNDNVYHDFFFIN